MTLRIGADIGGTFTDLILADGTGATFRIGKVLTTPDAPDDAVVAGVEALLDRAGTSVGAVDHVVHGTTLFTNALIERKGARTALITTRGFRDAVEIGREHRYDMYDLYMERPRPLAPRHLRLEADERVLADGTVLRPLDEGGLAGVIDQLAAERVEAVAVCLLHAYANPIHEQRIGALLAERLPGIAVTLSSELVPEIREYERTSTTLANVYVQRLAERYLGRLRDRLAGLGHKGSLFIMQSNGGVAEVAVAARFPVRLVESGPAAGAIAAAHYARHLGVKDLLSFDMGGTTAKACIIADGEPLIAPDFEVDRQYQFRKGSGLPVKVPVIEMIEIGTGGGSIARVDALGRLQVGPESAGAKPGPASYGRGGREPTVTDADLVLGYLDPDYFLGGEMRLDVEAARRAIHDRVAKPRGIDVVAAAHAIHTLANESMASAARIHAIERGKDVSRFPIFAFGGAGPVHAFGVARILRSPRVIYPLGAGVMSAVGFLVAPLALDFVRSRPASLEAMPWEEIAGLFEAMRREGEAVLARTVPREAIRYRRFADMRYRKQGYEIRVRLPDGPLDASRAGEVKAAFEAAYRSLYGQIAPHTPIDAVSWRLIAEGPRPSLSLERGARAGTGTADALKGHRKVHLSPDRGFVEVPVYDRYRLGSGASLTGPAIVEERESTVVVGEGARLAIDAAANLIADIAAAP